MSTMSRTLAAGAVALALAAPPAPPTAAAETEGRRAEAARVHYRAATIDGVEIAYREAGDPAAPTVSSSCTASRPPPTCSGS